MKNLFLILMLSSFILINTNISIAKVTVNSGGTSNGDALVGTEGPLGINSTARVSRSGGSIKISKARGKFTRRKVKLGSKVISRGTRGDEKSTHVDANAVFAGIGTFKSDDGNPVDNFAVGLLVNGTLRCKSPEKDLPEFNAIAEVDVDLTVDGAQKFLGGGIQDGNGSFMSSGDLANQFKSKPNRATIRKVFPVNLGMLSDGQKLAFFFLGSTLVSYGPDVPITFCAADFFRTSSFQPVKGQKGSLTIEEGKKVDVVYIDEDLDVTDGNEVLFIESNDSSIINDIKPGSVRVVIPGFETIEVEAGEPGDVNNNGIPDVVLSDPESPFSLTGFLSGTGFNSIFVHGQTNNGDAFIGLLENTRI